MAEKIERESVHFHALAKLIDDRRSLAAQVAGKDIEIAMALGDRDAAQLALRGRVA